MVQAFDPNKFNFQKALQTEVLFQFERASTDALQYSSSSMVRCCRCTDSCTPACLVPTHRSWHPGNDVSVLAHACPSRWLPVPACRPTPSSGCSRSQLHGPDWAAAGQVSGSPNLVYINVSPIEYGHVLLVPRVLDDLPQLADPATMLLALRFCQAADNPYFRLAFNSLGAYATINHLHFQVWAQGTCR